MRERRLRLITICFLKISSISLFWIIKYIFTFEKSKEYRKACALKETLLKVWHPDFQEKVNIKGIIRYLLAP